MLDFIGYVVTGALVVAIVSSIVAAARTSDHIRVGFIVVASLWAGLAIAAGAAGWFSRSGPPLIGLFLIIPLLVAGLSLLSPAVRSAALSLPLWLLIGLNAGRMFAFLFLALEAEGRLGGPFAFYAGWGDILTAAVALILASLIFRRQTVGRPVLHAWNLFGIADLLLAIFLGVTSAEGSPLQLIHDEPGSAAMTALPFSLVPSFLVPFYLIVHAVIWMRLASTPPRRTQ